VGRGYKMRVAIINEIYEVYCEKVNGGEGIK
jgi:hypothetical protein